MKRARFIIASFALALGALFGVALSLRVQASPGPSSRSPTLYVSADGDCGAMSPCYATIQEAVDAASDGDTVRVAQGVYTGSGFQVVFISKALALSGGYTRTDWLQSHPLTQPTVIDAESVDGRRGVYVDGRGVPTITLAGLTVQRGRSENSQGGAIHLVSGTVVLKQSRVLSSAAKWGGGVFISGGTVSVTECTVRGNRAEWGGGVQSLAGKVSLWGNHISANSAARGCGVHASGGDITLARNVISDNVNYLLSARSGGGGAYLEDVSGVVTSNTIRGNSATFGGGLYIEGSETTVSRNSLLRNVAYASRGGGMSIHSSSASIEGNLIRQNQAATDGGGLYVAYGIAELVGNSFTGNSADEHGGAIALGERGNVAGTNDVIAENTSFGAALYFGEAVYLSGASPYENPSGWLNARHWTLAANDRYALTADGGSAALTNTLVTSHAVAAFSGSGISAHNSLFYGNGSPCSGGASCTGSLFGDPRFVDAADGDYHIGPGSAAVDHGIDTGVRSDVDGEPRPMRSGFDIGADEQPTPPVAAFAHSAPEWVRNRTLFTNTTAVSGSASYLWEFGDGRTSTLASPAHVYTQSGDYEVDLVAINYGGLDTVTQLLSIFGAQFKTGSPDWLGQATAFTNTTVTSGTTRYLWQFGDGVTSVQKSPEHVYLTAGFFPVTLSATNSAGTGVATGTVTVYSPPTASFMAHPTNGVTPLPVTFTDTTSTTPPKDPSLTYLWRFGDGQTSTLSSPTHRYLASGSYTVTLSVTNAAGSDTFIGSKYVTVYDPFGVYLPVVLQAPNQS